MPPAKQILCLSFPQWSVTRRYRRRHDVRSLAVVVIRSVAQRRLVVDVSRPAQSRGVRCGMSAAEARALCADLLCVEQDTPGDHRALDALGRWLTRFTPVVARGWDDEIETPPSLFLDLTGCERLFHGIPRLVDLVRQSLSRFGIPVQMAVAPTPGAAWAFASTGGTLPRIVDAPSLAGTLIPLPVTTLRLDEEVLDDLRQLGLHRVGDVLALPRDQLPSRFGAVLLKRLDQLTGVLLEPLTKLVTDPPVIASLAFDAPVESLEDIWLILEKLLDRILVDLTRRNLGVRRLRMTFKPDRGWGRPTVTRTIALARPHRDRATLLNLIRCETERVDCEHGFVRLGLDVPLYESTADGQTQLFEQQFADEPMELDRLLQRLQVRLGESSVIRPELVESYLPERAWRPARDEVHTDNAQRVPVPADEVGAHDGQIPTVETPPPRPLTLFPTPLEIRVICQPSDDSTGEPRQFSWQGSVHRLTHALGPERIAGEWWRGHHRTRDYYDVEDEAGRRFWLFRVVHLRDDGQTLTRWFIHGRFD